MKKALMDKRLYYNTHYTCANAMIGDPKDFSILLHLLDEHKRCKGSFSISASEIEKSCGIARKAVPNVMDRLQRSLLITFNHRKCNQGFDVTVHVDNYVSLINAFMPLEQADRKIFVSALKAGDYQRLGCLGYRLKQESGDALFQLKASAPSLLYNEAPNKPADEAGTLEGNRNFNEPVTLPGCNQDNNNMKQEANSAPKLTINLRGGVVNFRGDCSGIMSHIKESDIELNMDGGEVNFENCGIGSGESATDLHISTNIRVRGDWDKVPLGETAQGVGRLIDNQKVPLGETAQQLGENAQGGVTSTNIDSVGLSSMDASGTERIGDYAMFVGACAQVVSNYMQLIAPLGEIDQGLGETAQESNIYNNIMLPFLKGLEGLKENINIPNLLEKGRIPVREDYTFPVGGETIKPAKNDGGTELPAPPSFISAEPAGGKTSSRSEAEQEHPAFTKEKSATPATPTRETVGQGQEHPASPLNDEEDGGDIPAGYYEDDNGFTQVYPLINPQARQGSKPSAEHQAGQQGNAGNYQNPAEALDEEPASLETFSALNEEAVSQPATERNEEGDNPSHEEGGVGYGDFQIIHLKGEEGYIPTEEDEPIKRVPVEKDEYGIPLHPAPHESRYWAERRLLKIKETLPYFRESEIEVFISDVTTCLDRTDKLFINQLWEVANEYTAEDGEDEDGNYACTAVDPEGQWINDDEVLDLIIRPAFNSTNDIIEQGYVEYNGVEYPVNLQPMPKEDIELIVDWEVKKLSSDRTVHIPSKAKFHDMHGKKLPVANTSGSKEAQKERRADYKLYAQKILMIANDDELYEKLTPVELAVNAFLIDYFEIEGDFEPGYEKGRGWLRRDELFRFCNGLSKPISADELLSVFNVVKTNNDGNYTLIEVMFQAQKIRRWNALNHYESIVDDFDVEKYRREKGWDD
jgi:hypothetical protein